jgi:hypothetical protein
MPSFFSTVHCLSETHCDTCRLQTAEGQAWRESIAKHFSVPEIDWPCPKGKPWLKEKPDKPLLSKALKAGSQAIGRVAGKEKISQEELWQRENICRECELLRTDETGEWCGELIRIRFGKDSKKKKGCGCLLNTKRRYRNFDCPRGLWPKTEG